ncbi:MAG: hypothetical protein PF450_10180 [Bacteroidales bacterium]|jgi:hypothetical protein|nr:hypothetical protein [Bacteroidales bacterium]
MLEFNIADGKQIVFNEANSSGVTHRYPLIKIKDASYKIFIDDKMVWVSLIGKEL